MVSGGEVDTRVEVASWTLSGNCIRVRMRCEWKNRVVDEYEASGKGSS